MAAVALVQNYVFSHPLSAPVRELFADKVRTDVVRPLIPLGRERKDEHTAPGYLRRRRYLFGILASSSSESF